MKWRSVYVDTYPCLGKHLKEGADHVARNLNGAMFGQRADEGTRLRAQQDETLDTSTNLCVYPLVTGVSATFWQIVFRQGVQLLSSPTIPLDARRSSSLTHASKPVP